MSEQRAFSTMAQQIARYLPDVDVLNHKFRAALAALSAEDLQRLRDELLTLQHLTDEEFVRRGLPPSAS